MKQEKRVRIANLPTPIEKMTKYSQQFLPTNIYIKRDDLTGLELSGNKIRKLEYCIGYALDNGYNSIITTGGLGSNHCRATALACKRFGLKCHLLLRGSKDAPGDGNYYMMELIGADIRYISADDYKNNQQLMTEWAKELEKDGEKSLTLPSGASSPTGCWGYFHAIKELKEYGEKTGLYFDTIVCSVGSGGTHAGLWAGNEHYKYGARIVGFNVCDTADYFKEEISGLIKEFSSMYDCELPAEPDPEIIGGYVGKGYAVSDPERMQFIKDMASQEGIFLDPVYTGKGFFGMDQEIKKGTFIESKNILFLHTGGIFGLFEAKSDFYHSSEFL